MDKLKFIGLVIGGLVVFYLFASVLMPFLSSTATDAATAIETGPNSGAYTLTVAGLRYAPFFLYVIPTILAMVLIILKLKAKI